MFQFTPVLRRATSVVSFTFFLLMFQFTPVLRRATRTRVDLAQVIAVSIHARLATGDPQARRGGQRSRRFNSRPSCDGRLYGVIPEAGCRFNSRPSCDGRLLDVLTRLRFWVSIHARLATGDATVRASFDNARFQFTPVLRRATQEPRNGVHDTSFNSRPSCDGRLRAVGVGLGVVVSIHARLATGDVCRSILWYNAHSFNSRPSCDGRR